jgi:uncharacterized repeat protein (TIGR03803 family)
MKTGYVVLAGVLMGCLGGFSQATADTFETLHTFSGSPANGSQPYGGLTRSSDGNFYGTTKTGGGDGYGTVFYITGAGTLTTIYNFDGSTYGEYPEAGVIQGSDSNFYGTTSSGGTFEAGTVFRIGGGGGPAVLHAFTGAVDGGNPEAGLVQGSDSNYYGTTSSGANGYGTLFIVTPSGDFSNVYSFTDGNDGANPAAGLVQGYNGLFYGTAYSGGASNAGTIFSFSLAHGLVPLYPFTGGLDGANPTAALVQGTDSNLYGTTFSGGIGYGTVFRVTTNGSLLTVLWDFSDGGDGGNPAGGLIQAEDGNFYGTTYTGGSFSNGTIFKITKNGVLTTLYNFTGGNDGAAPLASLLQASATNFLGTTSTGGGDFDGTIFSLIQPCTFSISPSHATQNGLANSGTFAVTSSGTGCVWTATSTVDWIIVTSTNTSAGNGVVAYSTTTNTTSKSRTGAISVAGKRFTVTQEAEVFGAFLPGTYNGLVMATNPPAQASSGLITLVLGDKGSFTASLIAGGVKSAFKGAIDPSGNAMNVVTQKNLSPLTVILQAGAVSNATDQIVGTVSNGTFTAQVVANLAVFSSAYPSPWTNAFTFVLAPADTNDTTVPQGYGYGTLTVTSLGEGSLKGVLGDGTAISGRFPVSGYGTWPLYESLYKNNGACIGWVTFSDTNTLSGTVYWFKGPSSSQLYSNGFSTALSLTGDLYTPPAKGGPSVAATGQLALGGGNLSSNFVITVSIATNGTGTASPPDSDGLKLKVAPQTGQMSGSFLDPTVGKAVKFDGLLLQSSGTASGYFLGTTESGFVTFTPEP